jgi:hypothetical protein
LWQQYPINMSMLFGLLTLFTALAIAGVAAWFSIVGLMTFFQGAALSIAVMAGTLEVGKLVTVSWLYRYWKETAFLTKFYLSLAVVFLMLITSIGIFGYLSKAHQEVSGNSADAFAIVERLENQTERENNKITLIEERIERIQNDTGVDNTQSIAQQVAIRDGAWDRVQGDINYAQGQIDDIRDQLRIDVASQDTRLGVLDQAVNDLRNRGVETVTVRERAFGGDEVEVIRYDEQAEELLLAQAEDRDNIRTEKERLRTVAQADIDSQQGNIDRYREQAQGDIDSANIEINNLRETSSAGQDANLIRIDEYNDEIDAIYEDIVLIREEQFVAEQVVRDLEKEIGPIKYVAELIYGASSADILDDAIRLFIILLVVVFDPLAVMLLLAANQTLIRYGINLEQTGPAHFVDEIIDNPESEDDTIFQKDWELDNLDEKRRISELERQLEIALAVSNKEPQIIEKEVIKEVIKEVEKDVNIKISTPRSIKALEKKLEKKLKDE